MPRLFIAIPVPSDVGSVLAAVRTDLTGARWVDPDHYHLTLRFLGEVDAGRIPAVVSALAAIDFPPVKVVITRAGTFPNLREPRVLFARVLPHPDLEALAHSVTAALGTLGFTPERRPYRAHITMARLRRADPVEVRRVVKSQTVDTDFIADAFALYESVLTNAGAEHLTLARFPSKRKIKP